MIDIQELLRRGHEFRDREHADSERSQTGAYRVGSVGAVTADGKILGSCHRKSMARFMGIESPTPFSQKILFKAGEANEFHWEELLGPVWEGQVLKHIDVEYKIGDLTVRGHPDIVLANKDGKHQLLVELKGIFGTTTAVKVFYENLPKPDNMLQAALYGLALGIPMALCYTNPNWVAMNFYDQKRYGTKHILPFYKTFYMEWRDGVLWYRPDNVETWVKTQITPQSIEDYYKLLDEMQREKNLGPRPSGDFVDGTESKWNQCGLCEWKTQCDRYDGHKNFDEWIKEIKDGRTE